MKELTKEEREFFEMLILGNPTNHNGYMNFNKQIKGRKYRIKRSRIIMQLHLNKKLSIFEMVHHKDGNKQNDSIENLEIISPEEHNSLHFAGKRDRKTTKGDFYQK